MFDVSALSQWQLLRLHTLISMVRAFAPPGPRCGTNSDERTELGVDSIVFPSGSCAKSFVDKAFDQLRESCKAVEGLEFFACRANKDDVAVSLVWLPGCGPHASDDGSAAPAYVTLQELENLDEAIASEARHKVNAAAVLHAVHAGLAAMFKDTLGLSRPAEGHQHLLNLPSVGLSTDVLRMALLSSGGAQQRKISDDDERAIAAIDAVSVVVEVVDTDALAPFHLRASTTSGVRNQSTAEGEVAEHTRSSAAAIRVLMTHHAAMSPRAVLVAALCHLQHASRVLWEASEPYATAKFPAARRRPLSEPLPPLLLLAATISNDRKRGPSSTLRFPHSLLEQLSWICEEAQRSPSDGPLGRHHLHQDHGEVLRAFDAFAAHRHVVEGSAQGAAKDEEPGDDETDEEYFYRVRPKTYLDLYLEYFPRSRAKSDD